MIFKADKLKKFGLIRKRTNEFFDFHTEYKWKSERFHLLRTHIKETNQQIQIMQKNMMNHSRIDRTFGEALMKRGKMLYEPNFIGCEGSLQKKLKEEYSELSDSSKETMQKTYEFFSLFGQTMRQLAIHKQGFSDQVKNKLGKEVDDYLKGGQACVGMQRKYEDTIYRTSSVGKKLDDLRKSLDKTERKSLTIKKESRKQKLKRTEESLSKKINDKAEEFESKKKIAALVEQATLDELQFQLNRGDLDYVNSLREFVKDYRQYFQTCVDLLDVYGEELGLKYTKDFSRSERKSKTVVTKVRDVLQPSIPTKIFEVDIEEVMERPTESGGDVPHYVGMMLRFLENYTHEEGIFRKAGCKPDIELLRKNMDRGELVDLRKYKIKDVHTIGSLLKLYVRTLPKALCPYEEFDELISLNILEKIRDKIASLPRSCNRCLFLLTRLLHQIHNNKTKSLMGARNLGIVWAYNIMRPEKDDPIAMIDISPRINGVVQQLVIHHKLFFPEDYGIEKDIPIPIENEKTGEEMVKPGITALLKQQQQQQQQQEEVDDDSEDDSEDEESGEEDDSREVFKRMMAARNNRSKRRAVTFNPQHLDFSELEQKMKQGPVPKRSLSSIPKKKLPEPKCDAPEKKLPKKKKMLVNEPPEGVKEEGEKQEIVSI